MNPAISNSPRGLADGASLMVPVDELSPEVIDGLARRVSELEASRLAAREPGGWPLAIAMIGAERIMERADSAEEWQSRVEGKRCELQSALQSRLSAFGRVEPIVVAAARQAPALAGVSVDETGGVGVVNLAHAVSERRSRYQQVRRKSTQRLIRYAISTVLACLVMIVGIVTAIRWAGPLTDDRLADMVRRYQLRERPTALRLSDARRPRVKAELQAIREDVAYSILDAELKAFIDERWRESERYDVYAQQFKPPQTAAGDCRSLDELDRLAKELRGKLTPPAEYAEAWAETEAVRLRQKWAVEIDALRSAEGTLTTWHHERLQRLHALTLTSSFDGDWLANVRTAMSDSELSPIDPTQPLPGSFELPVPGGEKLTLATAYEFDRVEAGRRDLQSARERLLRLRTLVTLLGLAGDPDEALLDIGTTTALDERWTKLTERHADWLTDPASSSVNQWGDPNRDLLKARLDRSRDRLLTAIHERIRAAVQTGSAESLARWQSWATSSAERHADEGRMFRLLETLLTGIEAPDPVAELVTAIRQSSWTLPIERLTVSWPESLAMTPKRIEFTIGERTISLAMIDEPAVDRGVKSARFESSEKSLTVPAGASVTIKLIAADTVLEWDRRPSAVLPFDLFAREPVIIRPGAKVERASGVSVRILPANRWPTRPVFMPDFAVGR